MGIGTSMGAYYDDSFHQAAADWDPKYDNNVVDPAVVYAPSTGGFSLDFDNNETTMGEINTNKQLDQVEQTELGGTEIGMKMPFPNNRNPDQDFNSRFGNLPPSGILNDLKPQNPDKPLIRKIGWQNNSEDFNNLPDDKYMANIDKSPGFFLKEEMQQQPWKRYSDRAKSLTKQTYDMYKSGDVDTVGAVQDWESRTLGRGYNDTDEGKRLKAEAMNQYGSKTTMTKNALWETYMQHLQDLAGSDLEDEKIPPAMKDQLEDLQLFDRVGRPQINLKPLWAGSKYK